MYKGKRIKKITHMSKRAALLVLSLVTILTVSVSGTLAYLIRSTAPAENTFIPGKITTETEETFDPDGKKTEVHITNAKNDGSLPVYVRAKVLFNWVKDGKVLEEPVKAADLDIKWVGNTSTTKWAEHDGYYYYQEVLMPGKTTTPDLIESCEPVQGAGPENAQLQVTILTQTLQADENKTALTGENAAWGENAISYVPDFPSDSST